MTDAPYHAKICNGPASGYALWREASDGVRLRIGLWPLDGATDTVLIYTGRTEYIEKYAHVAADLHAAGYAVATVDWRGQGLSDQLIDEPLRGHVGTFQDYQKDVQTLIGTMAQQGMPPAKALLGHSMGGCIALRSIIDGLPVKGALFSAPMWGILISPTLRPAAWVLSRAADLFGVGSTLTPGTNARSFILNQPFKNNTLTRDPEMWKLMGDQIRAVPGLELGGPSLHWLREALLECNAIMNAPVPTLPALTFLGDNERIVDASAVHTKMASWSSGRLRMVENAEHEVFMDNPTIRATLTKEAVAFLDAL